MTASIATVERETGIGKDTLRVWERRYGFPMPGRDASGDRVYPEDQVERLRLLRRLLDVGHRPGKVVQLGMAQLQELMQMPATPAPMPEWRPELDACLAQLRGHDIGALRRSLGQAVGQLGLARFVHEVVAPLNQRVGEAWLRGELQIFEEHLYTETVTAVLRHGLQGMPPGQTPGRPKVLLTTLPKEPHGLGLLMVETLLALDGCQCLSLGPQTPVADIAKAAAAHGSNVVALSFTGSLQAAYVLSGLAELRERLAPEVGIWAGGHCPVLYKRPIAGVVCIQGLHGVAEHLQRWQQVQA